LALRTEDQSYTDDKGRRRWRANDELAEELERLGDYLIICGYEESHARRYHKLAYQIARYPESALQLHRERRLSEIQGVGTTIAGIISEIIETGTSSKMEQWATKFPKSVLELRDIPGLGAKTIRTLYRKLHIRSLAELKRALDEDKLRDIKGIGKKTLDTMRRYVSEHA
jgi:DNA polymerase (family X)